jgi:hypothetical protein
VIRDFDVPKTDPVLIAKQAVAAIEAGDFEVLTDYVSHQVKGSLAGPITDMYPQLASN